MQDIDLMNELAENPEQGLAHIIEQYTGLVYSIINAKLLSAGTKEDVKECASDVFMEFYQQADQVDLARGSIKAYLAVIAKRKGIDYYRKLARCSGHAVSIDEENEQVEDFKMNPEQAVIDKEQQKCLLHAIAALGEPDKEIFIRKFYLGQKTKEIAQALYLRDNTVDKKISRGLKKLRILLGGVNYEEA